MIEKNTQNANKQKVNKQGGNTREVSEQKVTGSVIGRISAFQSLGAVDGPGLRYVVFMQGCPLRCCYCHNPETWESEGGANYTVEEVVEKILRFKPYIQARGGVTVSGGEALIQPDFVAALFKALQAQGLHTALDTSAMGKLQKAAEVLDYTDLVICDLKFATEEAYKIHTGGSLKQVQEFLKLTEKRQIPLWIRHVVVPKLTDSPENIQTIKDLAQGYTNLEKIELLPFKNICIGKYQQLGIDFPLKDTPPCSKATLEELNQLIK